MQAVLSGDLAAHPQGAALVRALQAAYQWLCWGLAGAAALYAARDGALLRLPAAHPGLQLGIAALLMAAAVPLVGLLTIPEDALRLPAWLAEAERSMRAQEAQAQRIQLGLLSEPGAGALLANLAVFALTPGICEELFFRGMLQRQLGRLLPPLGAIVITSLVFSAVHFQFYGFFARAALGMLLGLTAWRSGSLLPAMLGHAVFNGIMVIGVRLAIGSGMPAEAVLGDELPAPLWLSLLAAALTALLTVLLIRLTQPSPSVDSRHA
jgi:hypothetical protein